MSTLKEDLTALKKIQDGLVSNKVARFAYTQSAYDTNAVNGVNEYNVNNEQNIPNGTASIMKVNSTILDKGYRAQASSITRMLMNHFLGRISYNLNKINDNMQSLLNTLITKFPTSIPANGGKADTATKLQTARTINIQDSTATNTGTGASFDGSKNVTIKLPATIKANITGDVTGKSTTATTADKVAKSLTFGSKKYNGSSTQTISASDLGALTSHQPFSAFRPNLSQIKGSNLPFTVPKDGWILSFQSNQEVDAKMKIDNFPDTLDVLPRQVYLGQFYDSNSKVDKKVVVQSLCCPFPVKEGQVLSTYETTANVIITFAPCVGN